MNLKTNWNQICRNLIITLLILVLASALCLALQQISPTDTHVPLIFVLAVLCTSRFTTGYVYGIAASILAVVGVNFVFTYPYFALNFSLTGYPITFLAMLTVSIIVSTLTTQIKKQEEVKLQIERERLRNDLLRSVSHDIRTPLTSIIGAAAALYENDSEFGSEQRLLLAKDIKNEAEWLNKMVNNILSITRIDSVDKLHKEVESAEEILGSVAEKARREYPGITIRVSVPEELLLVPMDAILIEQVLMNLIDNAVSHGGTTKNIELDAQIAGCWAIFSVRDDGDGIAEEMLPRLFTGTLPAEKGSSDSSKHLHIGLSVCKSIITAHNGKIFAKNTENGACVIFELPLEG